MENTKISRTEPARLARIMLHPIALAVHFVFIMLINRLVWKEVPFSADGFLYGGWLGSFAFALIMTAFYYFSGYFFAAWRERGATWRALLSCVGAFCYTFSFTRFLMYGFFTSEFLHETWFDVIFWNEILFVAYLYHGALYFASIHHSLNKGKRFLLVSVTLIGHFFCMALSYQLNLWETGKDSFLAHEFLHGVWLRTILFALVMTFFFYAYAYVSIKWRETSRALGTLLMGGAMFFWSMLLFRSNYGFFTSEFLSYKGLLRDILFAAALAVLMGAISYFSKRLSSQSKGQLSSV